MKKKASTQAVERDVHVTPKVRAPNYYWNSSLFNEVYLQNDIPLTHPAWTTDENGPFHDFFQGFVDLCIETRAETFANEAQTVKDWVIPVMELLGWKNRCSVDNLSYSISESGKTKSYRPDLIYVDDPSEKALLDVPDSQKRLRAGRTFVKMVLEAKSWKRLDYISREQENKAPTEKSEKSDDTKALTPEEQCLKYMGILSQKYGILTDGNRWRLLHSELSDGSNKRYFEFALGYARNSALKLHQDRENEEWKKLVTNLKYFFYFFSRPSFYPEDGTTPFINDVLEYSKKYAYKIEEDLKASFIDAMTIICNGYKASLKKDLVEGDLELIRAVSESHLFNILFIKSCEVRNILPLKNPEYLKISLSEIIDTIEYPRFVPTPIADDEMNTRRLKKAFEGSFDYHPDGTELYERLMNLYDVVQNGRHGLEIVGFKQTVFEPKELAFAQKHKLRNANMVRLLFSLGYTPSEVESREYQQIPYNFFTPRQLGSIYESFLEFSLFEAPTDLIYHKGKWSKANLQSEVVSEKYKSCPKVKKRDLYFSYDLTERKDTGSYYTPDEIVRLIVEYTLSPILKDKSADEILKMRCLDPAMGSGHFLNVALEYLTNVYREAVTSENYDDPTESYAESAQKVLHSCVFGVDINPRAVKLAKLGLWLATAHPGRTLEPLDDQLKCEDSLLTELDELFDGRLSEAEANQVIVGNPPYMSSYSRQSIQSKKDLMQEYKARFELISGRINTFILFLEMSAKLAAKSSLRSFGYIVPKTILTMDSYDKIRGYLLEQNLIQTVIDCQYSVFENASVPTCILICGEPSKKAFQVMLKKDIDQTPIRSYSTDSKTVTEQFQGKILANLSDLDFRLKKHLEEQQLSRVGKHFHVADGINPGPFRAELCSPNKKSGSYREIIFKSGRVREYGIAPVTEKVFFNFSPKDIEKLYKQHPEKKNSLAVLGDLDRFTAPKILYRQTAHFPIAAYEPDGLLHFNSAHSITGGTDDDMVLLLTWLNSKLCRYYFYRFCKEKGDEFPQIKVAHMKALLMPEFKLLEKSDRKALLKAGNALIKKPNDQDSKTTVDALYYRIMNLPKAMIAELEKVEILKQVTVEDVNEAA